jgi:acyl-CoA-binding protein
MRSPQLYAFYKQATQDPPIDKAANPGTFDFKVSPATPLYNVTSTAQS